MRYVALAGAMALALSGCAEFDRLTATLASPQTTQAIANVQAGARALICALSTASAVAGQVESAVAAGQAVIGTTGKIYVASAIVCTSLGGVIAGSGIVK